jgi:hypothetical protein
MIKRLVATLGVAVVLGSGLGTPAYGYRGDDDCRGGGCGNEREESYEGAGCKYFCPTFDKSPVDFHDNNITLCMPFSVCDPDNKKQERPAPTP